MDRVMTIPKNLQEKRDDEKTAYELCTGPVGYSIGFNSACNLLLPEIKKISETLSTIVINDPDETTSYQARQALQSWREFLGEKSEGE